MIIAILCSDLHISSRCPVARSAEPDWYAAQMRAFDQLRDLQKNNCPVIIAGDVFDRWNEPAEAINFALDALPSNAWSVAGQHDLPNHSMAERERSAYWTLVKAGKLRHLEAETLDTPGPPLRVLGFSWGQTPHPIEGREDHPDDDQVYLAVMHRYVWIKGCGYPGAPPEAAADGLASLLRGYDAAVAGDNHKAFHVDLREKSLIDFINTGAFIRRKQDERAYMPTVGLLGENGLITPHHLDTSGDLWAEPDEMAARIEREFDVSGLADELAGLGADSLDFRAAVRRALEGRGHGSGVVRRVLEAIE